MSKLDILAEGREQGILLARRLVETAQNVQNEDLISRKWLMECIEEGWVKFDTAKDCNRMMHLVRDIAPSIQPEPHEGHWIGSDGSYICSECNGSPIDFIDTMGISFDAYIGTLMNYCPNCGAYMRGGDVE